MTPDAKTTTAETLDIAAEITKGFVQKVEQRILDDGLPFGLRGAHPRHHAVLKARFQINNNLDHNLQKGIFRPGSAYDAYVRFSNVGADPHDGALDARGVAIKVLRVEGDRIAPLEGEPIPEDESKTQDFLLTSAPVFIARDAAAFRDFMLLQHQIKLERDPQRLDQLRAQRKRVFPLVEQTIGVIRNPLRVCYFSQTPYKLGKDPKDLVVKYQVGPKSLAPDEPITPEEARQRPPNYLRQAILKTLEDDEDVVLEFRVQCKVDDTMPIDDATVPWDSTKSPFVPVAKIVIPAQQELKSPAMAKFAEDITFNPWHALEDHRPLGDINDARRIVYREMAKFRHVYREPTGLEKF